MIDIEISEVRNQRYSDFRRLPREPAEVPNVAEKKKLVPSSTLTSGKKWQRMVRFDWCQIHFEIIPFDFFNNLFQKMIAKPPEVGTN